MRRFSALIDRLIYTGSRNAKLALIASYLKSTPDPDRGWALAALTGEIDLPGIKSAAVRALAETRVDPVLLRLSRDFVGDTAETVALIWPENEAHGAQDVSALRLSEVVEQLRATSRQKAQTVLAGFLDRLDAQDRYALLKLATGGLRVGVSARLAKTAMAQAFGLDVNALEEIWHGQSPPYSALFAWAEGKGPRPKPANTAFRPFMLAHPLGEREVALEDFVVEWKWDGIRVQIAADGDDVRLYSRGGEDITGSFPDIARAFGVAGVVDGELLVRGEHQGGEAASFNALQQRLGRKTVSRKMLEEYPAFVRLYDLLFEGEEDLRDRPWSARRDRLEDFVARLDSDRFDISRLIEAGSFAELARLRDGARDAAIEGVMLKRRDSVYSAGRRVGLWYKWKRDPLIADCVMMYAQRGSGKRSSFYSDYTFGCWNESGELLPVGKAYSGFSDAELKELDRFVRRNTVARFGPVREVAKSLVLEVAFDSIHASKRHKSGLAMRFPRIHRIRFDKPAEEADRIATLQALIT